MKRSEIKEKLNKRRYSERWVIEKTDVPRIKTIVELSGEKKKILDIGCYDGTISEMIKNKGNEVFGVDISDKALKIAKKRGIKVKKTDTEKTLPFKENFFDEVVAGDIIEHIFDPDDFIKEIRRVLKKNGSIIITTPNLAGFGSRIMLLFGKTPWMIENSIREKESSGHIRYFTFETLSNLLERNEFRIDKKTSDHIMLLPNVFNVKLAKIFPSIGKSIIIKATKV